MSVETTCGCGPPGGAAAEARTGKEAPAELARAFSRPWMKKGGRPIDLFALCVLVLGFCAPASAAIDLMLGARRSAVVLILARSAPIVTIAVLVALIAVFRPEALSGRRPPRARRR